MECGGFPASRLGSGALSCLTFIAATVLIGTGYFEQVLTIGRHHQTPSSTIMSMWVSTTSDHGSGVCFFR